MEHVAHLTAHSFIGIGTHTGLLLPPPSPPAIYPHIAMDTLLGLTIKAKYSKTVIGPFGFQLIGQGNDSGMMVPHLCLPPNSVLVPIVIVFGSSKPMFSASTVKIDVDGEGLPTACNVIPYFPIGINQACNDPCNYPSDIVICPNTIVVGLTLGDFLSGLFLTVFDVAFSYAASWLGGKIGDKIVGGVLGQVWKAEATAIARQIGDEAGVILKGFVENALERPIGKGISTLIEKGFGVLVDPVGGWVGEQGDRGIHEAVDGEPPTPNPISSTGDALTGADGTDPRLHTAE
jgi:hypothetical protein